MSRIFEYHSELLECLRSAPFEAQGPVGEIPSDWADQMNLGHEYDLPQQMLSRDEVRKRCRNPKNNILECYLIIMAWGAQGKGPGGLSAAQTAWGNREILEERLNQLRVGRLSRGEAYNLFSGNNQIRGLGPSYLTKLLFFFSPNADMYVMDQWTTKAIILLTGKHIIRQSNGYPNHKNVGLNYELFCRAVDDLIAPLSALDGDQVEQRLFSIGSINGKPRGHFRQKVFDSWPPQKLSRYDHSGLSRLLKQIQDDPDLIFESQDYERNKSVSIEDKEIKFNLTLKKTYYESPQGFMNPGTDVSKWLGKHGDTVTLKLEGLTLEGTINRNAVSNGAVRIAWGSDLRDFYKKKYAIGDIAEFVIKPGNMIEWVG